MSKIIGVDVDGTVADLITEWLHQYNKDYDDNITKEDIHSWEIDEYVKDRCGKNIFSYLHNPSLYNEVSPITGALEGVKELRSMGHRVVFCTSANKFMAGRKLQWLSDHGFLPKCNISPDYVEMNDKGLLRVDVLIDDHIKNLEKFSGVKVLYRQPHNHSTFSPFTHFSAETWSDVVQYM